MRVLNSSPPPHLSLSLSLQRLKFTLLWNEGKKDGVRDGGMDPARDAVVGRGGVAAEWPRLPFKRELRGRVRRRRRSRCSMFG